MKTDKYYYSEKDLFMFLWLYFQIKCRRLQLLPHFSIQHVNIVHLNGVKIIADSVSVSHRQMFLMGSSFKNGVSMTI